MNVLFADTAATRSDPAFLDAASQIGRQLCRDAIWHDGACTWMGWAIAPTDGSFGPVYRTVSPTIYDGIAGIVLFLAQLSLHAPAPRLTETIAGAIKHMLARVPSLDTPPQRGFYTGTIGIAYVLTALGELLGDDRLTAQGLALAAQHAEEPFPPEGLDVMAGAASAIPVLIDLGHRFRRADFIAAALAHADRLRAAGVVEAGGGLSWSSQVPKHRNLLGYAHGAAGMAVALMEAYAVSRQESLRTAALEALRYERNWFDPARQSWPDFRIDTTNPAAAQVPPNCNCTWCNGSTGIGLTRLRMMELMADDGSLLYEVNAALQDASRILTTSVVPQSADLCLCHGLAGIADFVLSAGLQLQRDDVRVVADQVGRFIIEQYLRPGMPLPCGVYQRGESPCLMTGIAGVGYFFLRLYERSVLPSLLLLKPADPPEAMSRS